jgi:hypothetical protein
MRRRQPKMGEPGFRYHAAIPQVGFYALSLTCVWGGYGAVTGEPPPVVTSAITPAVVVGHHAGRCSRLCQGTKQSVCNA